MTCAEVREFMSALVDEAVSVAERQAIESHLATCAECRQELAELRETVSLLKRLPPVHAPAGFVDRVVETAYRPSWPRRIADALFRPLRVKLPLEAAAVVLVGVSALYVYQRAPEVRQVARQETREAPPPAVPSAPPAAPSVTGDAGTQPSAQDAASRPMNETAELEAKRAPTPLAAPSPAAPPAEPPPSLQRDNVAPSTAPGATASATAPAAVAEAPPPAQSPTPSPTQAPTQSPTQPKIAAQAEAKKETVDRRREDTAGAAPAESALRKQPQSAEPAPSRDAAGARATAPPAPPAVAAAPPPEARGRAGGAGAAAPAVPAERGAEPFSVGKPRAAAKLTRASDASGRLVVRAPEPAEIALDALLNRLGGTRVARRLEGPQGLILIDVIVPAARYPQLLEGLGKIGRWTTEHEPKTLPLQVRVEVALGVEP
jgi:hypothetical protein